MRRHSDVILLFILRCQLFENFEQCDLPPFPRLPAEPAVHSNFCFVRPRFRPLELCLIEVLCHHFQRLTVFLVHGKKEKRQHHCHHAKCSKAQIPAGLEQKKTGTPISAPAPKQRICRLVRFIKTLVLTFERSRGTEI